MLIACSLFLLLCSLLAGETYTIIAPGGGVIAYTNADAKSAFDFLSRKEGARRAQRVLGLPSADTGFGATPQF